MNTLSIRRSPRTELACTILAGLSLAARRRPTYLVWIVALILVAFTGCLKENPVEPEGTVSHPGAGSAPANKIATVTWRGNRQAKSHVRVVTGRGLIAGKLAR